MQTSLILLQTLKHKLEIFYITQIYLNDDEKSQSKLKLYLLKKLFCLPLSVKIQVF